MNNQARTKKELIEENTLLKQRIQKLEHFETQHKQLEAKILESQRLFDAMLNAALAAMALQDRAGLILECNEAFARRLGRNKSEIIGENIWPILSTGVRENRKAMVEKVFQEGQPLYLEDERQGIWNKSVIYPLFAADGTVASIFIYAEDITEHKKAQKLVEESEQRYRELVQSANSIILKWKRNGEISFLNEYGLSFFGFSEQEILGKSVVGTIVPITEEFGRDLAALMEDLFEHPDRYEKNINQNVCKDGRLVWISWTNRAVLDEQGRSVEMFSIGQDITDRKQAERALRESQRSYMEIINFLPDATLVIDKTGKVTAWNRAMEEMSGIKAEDMIGKGNYEYAIPFYGRRRPILIDLALLSDEEFLKGHYDNIERRGCVFHGEVLVPKTYRGKGAYLWGNATKLYNENGEVIGAIESIRDITDRKVADEALRNSEERLNLTLDAVNEGVWDWHIPTGEVVFSSRYYTMLGYEPYEFSQDYSAWRTLVHPDDIERAEREINRCINNHEAYSIEIRMRTKTSDWCWILTRGKAIEWDDQGKAVRMVGAHSDISERKRTEEALHKTYLQYQLLIEQAADGIFIIDKTGNFFIVNSCLCQMLGYTQEELLKTNILDTYPENEIEIGPNRLSKIATGEIQQFERLMVRKDGSEFWIEARVRVLDDETIQAIVRDITDRKMAADAQREQLYFLQQLIDAIPNPIFFKNTDGLYLGSNKAFDVYLGKSKEQIIGRTVYDLSPKDLADKHYEMDEILFHMQGVQIYESNVLNADGTRHDVIFSKAPYYDRHNHLAGLVGVIQDVTDIRRTEAERQLLEERLRRAEKMEALGLLSGGVAHDLNNVLGILIGYSELLLLGLEESSPLRPYATTIMSASERAGAIIQDMLTLARRGVQTRKVVNLNVLIRDFMKTPEFERITAFHPNIRIETSLEIVPLNIMGSSHHIGKTIMNLAANAAEAMPKGGLLAISTSNRYMDRPVQGYDEVREGDYVVLSVSDTGEGISGNDIQHIFEPFYTKKTMGRSGTGLGLAVVWGAVKDHDGYIDVQSEEGKGSTFSLYFPVTREELSEERISVSMAEYMGKGESILVVDDIEGQRELAARMLEKLNYRVDVVASGEESFEYMKDHQVDLVILDMIMDPGMDGLDTYRKILELHPKQKAIIVSGFSETERVRQVQDLGAGAYVKKPYVMEKLGLAVRKELDAPNKQSEA